MWGKLTSLASVVTGQDGSDEEEERDQPVRREGADDHEMQLVEQEKLIIQLKEMIRDRENSLVEKDNELKKVSADFSRFKLQTKSKITGLSKQVQESQRAASDALERASIGSDESVSTSASEVSSQGSEQKLRAKLSVARKQLQIKEKHLQDLNLQLEKKKQEVEAKERVLIEKNDELEKLRDVKSKFKEESSQEEQESSDETKKQLQIRLQEMIAQLAYKDNKILELVNQISEHEGGAMDLQECLAEKDVVIKGRDQAIALLRASLKEYEQKEAGLNAIIDRMKWKQDDLEESIQKLKEELKWSVEASKGFVASTTMQDTEKELEEVTEMREKFSALLAEEKTNSASALEEVKATCDLRCRELEGRLTEYGAARDALLSRVEELEGLLESMTQDNDDLRKQLKATEEAELKEGGNKFSKFKSLAGSKIKALEKEVELLREQNNELNHLRNRVTELEEDKGNLQLQIVDNEEKLAKKEMILTQLDEMRQQCEDFLLEINNLRDKNTVLEEVARKHDDTMNQLKKAESDREAALIRSEEQEATIKCLEARFEGLRKQLEERAESLFKLEKENSAFKLLCESLERRVKESEEEVLRLTEANKQLKGRIESTDGDVFVFQKTLNDLRVENKSLRGQIEFLQGIEEQYKMIDEDLRRKCEELEKVKKTLLDKNKLLEDASIKLIDTTENSSLLSQKLEERNSQLRDLWDQLESLSEENKKNVEIIKTLTDINEKLKEKTSSSNTTPPLDVDEFESSCSPFSENVKHDAPEKRVVVLPVELMDKSLRMELEDTKQEIENLKNVLRAKEEELELLKNACKVQSFQTELEALRSLLDERNHSLDELRLENEKLSQKNVSVERLVATLLEENEAIKLLKLEQFREQSNFDNREAELKTLLTGKDEMIQNLLKEREVQSLKLTESESALSDLKQTLDNEAIKSETFEKNLALAQNDLAKSHSETEELKLVVENLSKELKEKDKQLDASLEKQQEFDNLLVEFDATVLKLKESHDDRHTYESEIKGLRAEISQLTLQCESLKHENNPIQESHISYSISVKERLNKSNDDLVKGKEEVQNMRAKDLHNESLNAQMIDEILRKDESLVKMSENLEQTNLEIQKLKRIISEKDSELDILRLISKEAQTSLGKPSDDIKKRRTEVDNLQQFSESSKEIESGQSQKTPPEDISMGISKLDDTLQQLTEELSRSKMEAADLRENVKQLEKKLLDKEKKIQSLSDILEEEEAQLVASKEDMEKLKKSSELNVTTLQIKDEEIVKLTETLKEKETVIKKYLAIMKKQKDSLKQAKEDLNHSLNTDDEVKKLHEKILILEQELSVLKDGSASLEAQFNSSQSQCMSQESVLDELSKILQVKSFLEIKERVKYLLASSSEIPDQMASKCCDDEPETLQMDLDQTKKEIDNLNQKLASQEAIFEAAKKSFEDQKHDLEISLACLKDVLSTKEQLLDSVMLEKDDMRGEIRKLREECSSLEEKFASMKAVYEDELNKVNQMFADEKRGLLEEHQEKINDINLEHQQKVDSMNSELKLSQKSLSNFKKEVEVLTEKINELKRIHEEDIEHFIKGKQENEMENLKLASKISDITSGKLLLEDRIADLTKELLEISERFSSLLQENQLLKENLQSMELTLSDHASDKSKRNEEISFYKSNIENLELRLSDAIQEKNELLEKQKNLTEQIENHQSQKAEVTKKLEELSNQSENVVKEKELFQLAAQNLKMEIEKLQCSDEQDHPSLSHLKECLEACENSKQELEREVKSLRTKLSEKVKQNENISRQLQGEMKKLEILEMEFEEIRLENQQMAESNGELQTKLQDLRKFNQEIIKRKDELSKTVDHLSKEVAEKDIKLKNLDESLIKALGEGEAKVAELNQKIILLEKERNNHEKLDSDQSEDIYGLKRGIQNLEIELCSVKEQSASEIKALQSQYDLLSNDVTSYQHLISKLENNKRHLETQMTEVKPMMSKLKEELKRQEAEKLHLKRSISLLEAEKSDLITEIDRLRQRVKMAEDLEDNLEMDYKHEVNIYKDKLKEMEEALERSQKAEEELNQVNDKLLQHNNALIRNNEDLFDQLSQYSTRETTDQTLPDATAPLLTLTKERDHFKLQVDTLKAELDTLRNEFRLHSESPPTSPKVQNTESIIQERLQGSSPQIVQENLDVPRVHFAKPGHLSSYIDFEEVAIKSQLGSLSAERDSLLNKLTESEKKFSEKERELSEFYQQYQLLYQQFSAVQQHLITLQKEKDTTPSMTSLVENTSMVPYEKYKDLESLNRQLRDQHRHLENQLQIEQERRLEVEEGMKVIRDQYEQHRLLQGGTSNENHSVSIFSMEEDERKVLPQDASLYVQLRHRCLQFKRILMRMDQTRYSLGTIYRYRAYLWKFLIFYFIFIHLFIISRCWT